MGLVVVVVVVVGSICVKGVCSQALEMLSQYGTIKAGGLVVACAADETADDTESKRTNLGSCAKSRAEAVTAHTHSLTYSPTHPYLLMHSSSLLGLVYLPTHSHPITHDLAPTYIRT